MKTGLLIMVLGLALFLGGMLVKFVAPVSLLLYMAGLIASGWLIAKLYGKLVDIIDKDSNN